MTSTALMIRTAAMIAILLGGLTSCQTKETAGRDFIRVEGRDLIDSHGNKFFIKGTNTGNWLNPEGYMFGFSKVNSPRMINEALSQLVGPTEAKRFWQEFKDRYITRSDFEFIASTGANTVRIPFHYKLFTNEDYMGLNDASEGFRRLDSCISWARDCRLRLILDMHDCPGGQTGDNIDDSYGYPWLFTDSVAQKQFVDIWRSIASRYSDNDVILGYELANEPIATYWDGDERTQLNAAVEPLYKRAVEAIRGVDPNHIILLGGPQWNGYFGNFTDWSFDDNIMFTCHRYGGEPTPEAIAEIIDFRNRTDLPMYMGEIGHNTCEWMESFVNVMRDNNIGYTFWPYKKLGDSAMTGVTPPSGWFDELVAFVEAPRATYSDIREARKHCSPQRGKLLLDSFLTNAHTDRMTVYNDYITAIQLDK